MVKKKVLITNPAGFHLRPAGILCQEAASHASSVHFIHRNSEYNAKSVLSVLGSGVRCGDIIEVICEGPDENEALLGVETVLEQGLIAESRKRPE